MNKWRSEVIGIRDLHTHARMRARAHSQRNTHPHKRTYARTRTCTHAGIQAEQDTRNSELWNRCIVLVRELEVSRAREAELQSKITTDESEVGSLREASRQVAPLSVARGCPAGLHVAGVSGGRRVDREACSRVGSDSES
jgi:hypothetical protein